MNRETETHSNWVIRSSKIVLGCIISFFALAIIDGSARALSTNSPFPSLLELAAASATSMAMGTVSGLVLALVVGTALLPTPAKSIGAGAIIELVNKPVHVLLLAATVFLAPIVIGIPIRSTLLPKSAALSAVLGLISVTLGWTLTLIILRRLGNRKGRRLPQRPTGWVLAMVFIAVSVLGAAYRPVLDASDLWDLFLLGMLAFGVLGIVLVLNDSGRLKTIAIGMSVLSLAAGGFALAGINSNMTLRLQVGADWRPSSWVVETLKTMVDMDGDGFSPLFGGGDCNDSRDDINPDQFEIAGNGIDENCRNGDRLAKPPWPPRPKFVPLPEGVRQPRSILLISIDALRQDHVGAYGYHRPVTPRIDRLASKGVLFANARSSAPTTRIAIPVMHTGLFISQIPWDRTLFPYKMLPEVDTVAEILKRERQMKTASFVTHSYLGKQWGFSQGFDHVDESLVLPRSKYESAITGEDLADNVMDWIEQNKDESFFAWVHFFDPHLKYYQHEDGPVFGKRNVDRYDSEILYTDKHIGRVLDKLDELGISEDTMVILTSDHGEFFGEHGKKSHGHSLYKENSRVPLIVRSPGLTPRVAECVHGHVDLAPTVLNFFGIDPADYGMSGASLVPDMTGNPCDPNREVPMEIRYGRLRSAQLKAIVGMRWKLVLDENAGTYRLFDLDSDPDEKVNLVTREPKRFQDMKRRLLDWSEFYVNAELTDIVNRLTMDKLPASAHPLDALFENGVEFVGLDFADRTVSMDDTAYLQLFLRTKERVRDDCLIHFYVVDEENRTRQRTRHPPVSGLFPFKQWPLGRIVKDSFVYQLKGRYLRSKKITYRTYDVRLGLSCDGDLIDVVRGDVDSKGRLKAGQIEIRRSK